MVVVDKKNGGLTTAYLAKSRIERLAYFGPQMHVIDTVREDVVTQTRSAVAFHIRANDLRAGFIDDLDDNPLTPLQTAIKVDLADR